MARLRQPNRTTLTNKLHRERATAILSRQPENVPLLGVEVGVATGRLSVLLLRARPFLTLTMVDLWAHNPSPHYAATHDVHSRLTSESRWDHIIRTARKRTAAFRARMVMIQSDSVAAAARFADGRFDFAFIDDDHSFPGCLRSLKAWFPKIKPGGWFGGHDYGHTDPAYAFQVTEAVHAFFGPRNLPIELDVDFTWFVRVPNA